MSIRLNKAIKEFGVGLQSITDLLKEKGAPVATNDPNQKLDDKQYELLRVLRAEFESDNNAPAPATPEAPAAPEAPETEVAEPTNQPASEEAGAES